MLHVKTRLQLYLLISICLHNDKIQLMIISLQSTDANVMHATLAHFVILIWQQTCLHNC